MKLILLSLAILIFGSSAQAMNNCPGGIEPYLKAITRNPNAIRIEGEMAIGGIILQPGEKLPQYLDDDLYIYLIDSKKRIVYSSRSPDLSNEIDPLMSHRALTKLLKKTYPNEKVEILAAGEFQVSQGKIPEINNKANTYHGDEKNLEYAKNVFQQRGLNVESGTQIRDYSKQAPSPTGVIQRGHILELDEVRLKISHLKNPIQSEQRKIIKDFERRVYKTYPSKIPGKPDWEAFYHTQEHKLSDNTSDLPSSDSLFENQNDLNFFQALNLISDVREPDFWMDKLMVNYPKVEGLKKKLEGFEGILLR